MVGVPSAAIGKPPAAVIPVMVTPSLLLVPQALLTKATSPPVNALPSILQFVAVVRSPILSTSLTSKQAYIASVAVVLEPSA